MCPGRTPPGHRAGEGAMSEIEEWRTVPHAPIYEVSSMGAVRLRVNHGNRRAGLVLRGTIIRGYRWHNLTCDNGKQRMNSAHSLVLAAFVGPRPTPDHHGAHSDANRSNNSISNLRWATIHENMADGVRHGSWKGERHSKAILTEANVKEIRRKYSLGEARIFELARSYGVCQNTIKAIIIRKSWKHV